jgi:hypothetical protein
MKCPLCDTKDSLLLLNSFICVNKSCENFDEEWAKEVEAKKKKKENPYDPYIVFDDDFESLITPPIWTFDRDD